MSKTRTRRSFSDRDTITVEIKKTTHKRASKVADDLGMKMMAFCNQCVLEGSKQAETRIRAGKTQLASV